MQKIIDTLSNYNGTLSTDDQKTLRRIFKLDTDELPLLRFNPFFWKNRAVGHFNNLNPDSLDIVNTKIDYDMFLNQYTEVKMKQSLKSFPFNLPLDPMHIYINSPSVYDPRFALMSVYHLLSLDRNLPAAKFIRSGFLSLAIMATSSDDKMMRKVAYACIARLYSHLGSDWTKSDEKLWIVLIDFLRASMIEKNQQMPLPTSSFIALFIQHLCNADGPRSRIVIDFIKQKPCFNSIKLDKLLGELIHSCEPDEWRYFQDEFLTFLSIAFRNQQDYDCVRSQLIIPQLMEVCLTDFIDSNARRKILQFLQRCLNTKDTYNLLTIHNGFLVWLHAVIRRIVLNLDSLDHRGLADAKKEIKSVADIFGCFKRDEKSYPYATFHLEIEILTNLINKCNDLLSERGASQTSNS